MQATGKKLTLLALGLVIGASSIGGYRKIAPVLPFGPLFMVPSDDRFAAACMMQPSEGSDPILFISCGGIF